MTRGNKAVLVVTLVVFWSSVLLAQKPPSLEEQLRAQYEPATALTVQKPSVFAVAPASSKICPVKYQEGKLIPAELSCLGTLTVGTRVLAVGEKINPATIDVDLAKEKISFHLVECDSCNKVTQPSSYKAQIDFQFAKGYLEQASVPQVVDAISEVLAFPDMAQEAPPQAVGQPEQVAQPNGTLTNNDVIKMAKVHLPDSIILSKIKSSPCNFDTSVDGLIKLKEAGVSEAVLQAMQDMPSPEPAPPSPPPGTSTFSVIHRHFVWGNPNVPYCTGTLSVSADGTVAYDCTQADETTGRCDHVSFPPGSLKQAKMGIAGNLHLASKTQGNYDFYGDQAKAAYAVIAPLVQTTQK